MLETVAKILAETFAKELTKDAEAALASLIEKFRKRDGTISDSTVNVEDYLPTVGMLGVGRCGTNIALALANEIASARSKAQVALKDGYQESSFITKLLSKKVGPRNNRFLVDPVIIAADLDGDTAQRIQKLNPELSQPNFKFDLSTLTWLNSGGAGNIPLVGQYMALLSITAKDVEGSSSWNMHKSYFVDSAGMKLNNSRLYFYIFSCGGGSGSGMAPVLAYAQQKAYFRNLSRQKDAVRLKTEPICSIGIGVMPGLPPQSDKSQIPAQFYNAGRMICQNMAAFNSFDTQSNAATGGAAIDTTVFDCLLLFSNDIGRHASIDGKSKEGMLANKMEEMTNKYIAQQMFNLVSAQAMISDYGIKDEAAADKIKSKGISLGDQTKLDAADLKNSLIGPALIAFGQKHSEDETIEKVFYRSIFSPTINTANGQMSFEGISVLPRKYEEYISFFNKDKGSEITPKDANKLIDLPAFNKALSVVAIISSPSVDQLRDEDLKALQALTYQYFPNAKINRLVKVFGTSESTTLTTIISGSACFCTEVSRVFSEYVYTAFYKKADPKAFVELYKNIVQGTDAGSSDLESSFNDYEDIGYAFVSQGEGAWAAKCAELEGKRRSITGAANIDAFPHPNDMKIGKNDVISALTYMRRRYTYKNKGTLTDSTDF